MYQFTPDQPNMWVSPSPGYDPPRAPEALVIAAVAAGLIGTCCLCLAASSVLAGIPLAAIAKSTRDAVAQQASAAPTMTAAMARLSATATVQAYWPLVISDTFDDNENGWRVGNASDSFADTSWTISGGAYHWTLAAHRSVHWFIVPDLPALSVFRAGVTAVSSGQTANAEYGLVFRHADNDNYYYFAVQDSGRCSARMQYNGVWMTLADWPACTSGQPGQAKRIEVVGDGSHFTFFVNHQLVGEIDDSQLDRGRVGLAVETWMAGNVVDVSFDDFELREAAANSARAPSATALADTAAQTVARIYRDWKPIFAIDFASNDDPSWTPSRIDYSNVRGKEIIQNGHLAIQATATQEAFWDQAANTGYVTDFFATLEVEQTAGERAEYGMEFRRNDATGFYWLAINGDGEYAVYMFNDAWSTLIGWTRHPAILSGTKNRLAIIGIGSDFTIIINDQYVTEFKSDVLPGGRLGIALQLSPSSKQATIQFDNIELRAP